MSRLSTQGWQPRLGPRWWRAAVELLSSMRFAIALLVVIALASIIGTVLPQHPPYSMAVGLYGVFWADVFEALGFFHVYQSAWFLALLVFLVLSTSLCVLRNLPKIRRDLGTFKEGIRAEALQAFGHKAAAQLPQSANDAAQALSQQLAALGWKLRMQERTLPQGENDHAVGFMLAAKKGSTNRLAYIAGHSAVVLVCLGGLLDSRWLLQMQMAWQGKQPYQGAGRVADVPAQHRMSSGTLGYRGTALLPEGARTDAAVLAVQNGVLIQPLPFALELQKFTITHYPDGTPRSFGSQVLIHDAEKGEPLPARIAVNHPLSYRGVTIYQSGFEDGGSQIRLQAWPLQGGAQPVAVQAKVGTPAALGDARTLEITALETVQVQRMDAALAGQDADVGAGLTGRLRGALRQQLGAAHSAEVEQSQRELGPSIQYTLRDAAGQPVGEFHTYLRPLAASQANQDAAPEFLFGVRSQATSTGDVPSMRYLRIPADQSNSLADFARLRAALYDPARRAQAVQRYIRQAAPADNPALAAQLQQTAQRLLQQFAGDPALWPEARRDPQSAAARSFGLSAVAALIEQQVPPAEQARMGEVMLQMLHGSLLELLQAARTQEGLPLLDMQLPRNRAFVAQAVLALGDIPLYPEPQLLQLQGYEQVQASVFQLARMPGRWLVYLGSVLLVLGMFGMLFIRERRLWLWLAPAENGGTQATLAYSSNRRNADSDREFDMLTRALLADAAKSTHV
ncbi:MAG: cytochrome c biogenesis protein ResB [Brachymonas sp.]|nr:cytochrome c biogenesis protein ResB [Brachymonas sp.]